MRRFDAEDRLKIAHGFVGPVLRETDQAHGAVHRRRERRPLENPLELCLGFRELILDQISLTELLAARHVGRILGHDGLQFLDPR